MDPISPSQLIVSQSQLLPSFWPVIGAKRPIILVLLCARVPTQRPERLQENVIERPFMHPQSQRSIPRVYLYRLRSITPKARLSAIIFIAREICSASSISRPLQHHPLGRKTATNFADALVLCFVSIMTKGCHRNGSAMLSTIEQCVFHVKSE